MNFKQFNLTQFLDSMLKNRHGLLEYHLLPKVQYPGNPTTIFYRLVSEPPFLVVRVYHDPKGTTIFACGG